MLFIGLFASFLFLFRNGELDSFLNEKVDQINTRTTGDEKYDVLGYGYDITDEYLGENAVKLQVINVQAFVNDGEINIDLTIHLLALSNRIVMQGKMLTRFLKI